jgi:hypothetical protein
MNPPENPSERLRLESIANSKPKELSNAPDAHTTNEQSDLARQRIQVLIRGEEQDIKERKTYANRNFWLIVGWLVVIIAMLLLQGFKIAILGHSFDLPTSVLLAVIGSATVNVLGIFVVVTNYLFRKK